MPDRPDPDQTTQRPASGVAQRQNLSVHKAAAVLRAAADHRSGASVSALARAARLPRATAVRMIESLITERFLTRLPDDRIVIGPGLVALARATDLAQLVQDAAWAPMQQLVRQVGESVTLTVGTADGTLAVVRQLDGSHMLGLVNWVGRPVPMHASSAGKLALAFGPPDRVEALLRSPLPRLAARTLTEPEQFREELTAIRSRGWAQIEDELEDGLTALSAGVWLDSAMVASINISGPATRFGERARLAALPALTRACRATERHLGGVGGRRD